MNINIEAYKSFKVQLEINNIQNPSRAKTLTKPDKPDSAEWHIYTAVQTIINTVSSQNWRYSKYKVLNKHLTIKQNKGIKP